MTYLKTFDNLICEIQNKINRYQKGDKLVTKKEVEDFIYFLRECN